MPDFQLPANEGTHLATEKARADVLLSSIGEAVIATDEYGKIMKINQAALDLFGYEEHELLGKSYMGAIHAKSTEGEPIEPLTRPIMRSLLEGKTIIENLRYVKKSGNSFPTIVTVSPIMLGSRPIGTIQIFRDITREQEIDRAKTEFVSLASHQLRTPLTAVRWYLELLLRGNMGKLTPEQHASIQEVHNVTLNMIDLVSALLSVARIEAGTLTVTPVLSDIVRIAREAVVELEPQITEKQLTFEEDYDTDLPPLQLDRDLTRIIFQNLLSNAVKYTPAKGRVSLKIARDKNTILIQVTDTGYGVPKRQQRFLFTKLFRADNVRQKDTDGTGLGLYIVRSIVDESKGKIWFESEEDKGTTFYVRLPLSGMKTKKHYPTEHGSKEKSS